MTTSRSTVDQAARRRWMSVLAHADEDELEQAWQGLDLKPERIWVRPPETGMAMVRGRAGGDGEPFNLGEMTVTRCALRLDNGTLGVAYARGRSHRHAELAAMFDALLQVPQSRSDLERRVIAPLDRARRERAETAGRRAAATRVDFFTMATGRREP